MLKATLTLEGSLEQIERAASLLIAGGKIEAMQMHAVEEPLNEAETRLMTRVPEPPTAEPSEAEQAAEAAQEQQLAPAPKRKHRKKADKNEKAEKKAGSAPASETPEAAAPAPETPSRPNGSDGTIETLPDLETLKGLVVNAVKIARAGGGDNAIMALLPDFKKRTKLPFVMEAKEEHRAALLDLLNKAGIAVE